MIDAYNFVSIQFSWPQRWYSIFEVSIDRNRNLQQKQKWSCTALAIAGSVFGKLQRLSSFGYRRGIVVYRFA